MVARLGVALAAVVALWAGNAFAGAPKVGAPAPAFQANLLGGGKVSLADLRGQVVVLNFWATWCGPCRRELPLLNVFAKVMKEHGLKVIAVASDDSAAPWVLKEVQAKLDFPLASRIRGPYEAMGAYPTNFVIDRAGVVRYAKAAAFTLDTMNEVLIPLLREPPPDDPPVAAPTAGAPIASP